MGRNRNKLFYGAVHPALSPVQELSGESRSPTPASEHGDCTSGQKSGAKANQDLTPEGSVTDVVDQSFTDFLMEQLEQYREQTMCAERHLRQERQKNEELQKKVNFYKTEYNNYRLSWTMDQAKIKELQVMVLELKQKNKVKLAREDRKMSVENHLLEKHQSCDETTVQKSEEIISVTTSSCAKSEKEADPKPSLNSENAWAAQKEEDDRSMKSPSTHKPSSSLFRNQGAFPPRPPSRSHSRTRNRRPFTGRSRNCETPKLPAIVDAKNHAEKDVHTPPLQSSTSFPIVVPNRGMVFPVSSTSLNVKRRNSKVPVTLPHLRGASSTGSVPSRRQRDNFQQENH